MKKFLCFVLSLLTIQFAPAFALDFTDVNKTEDPEISFLADTGVVNGRAEGIFAPDELVNRAEMLKILFDLVSSGLGELQEELPTVEEYHDCFTDVSKEWFAPYVCSAKERGVIDGYPDGSFRPGESVNLVEALKMVFEVFKFDLPDGAEWYSKYYDAAISYDSYGNKNYKFDDSIDRRTMAQIATRIALTFMTQEKFDPEILELLKESGKSFGELYIGFFILDGMVEVFGGDAATLPSRVEVLKSILSTTPFDAVRQTDITSIYATLTLYSSDHNSLYPLDIYDGSLNSYFPSGEVPVDPVTSEHYSYVVSEDQGSFKVFTTLDNGQTVCAHFVLMEAIESCEY